MLMQQHHHSHYVQFPKIIDVTWNAPSEIIMSQQSTCNSRVIRQATLSFIEGNIFEQLSKKKVEHTNVTASCMA